MTKKITSLLAGVATGAVVTGAVCAILLTGCGGKKENVPTEALSSADSIVAKESESVITDEDIEELYGEDIDSKMDDTKEYVSADPSELNTPLEPGTYEGELVTYGYFKSFEKDEDANGEYGQATFTDAFGNDFIANIYENTESPDSFEEGKCYAVYHDEVETLSLPGIFPHVSKIVGAEMPDFPGADEEPGVSRKQPITEIPEGETSADTQIFYGEDSVSEEETK